MFPFSGGEYWNWLEFKLASLEVHTFHKIPESSTIIGSFCENKVHNLFILFQNGLGNVLHNPLSVKFIYVTSHAKTNTNVFPLNG